MTSWLGFRKLYSFQAIYSFEKYFLLFCWVICWDFWLIQFIKVWLVVLIILMDIKCFLTFGLLKKIQLIRKLKFLYLCTFVFNYILLALFDYTHTCFNISSFHLASFELNFDRFELKDFQVKKTVKSFLHYQFPLNLVNRIVKLIN